jgi:hypothetical protein
MILLSEPADTKPGRNEGVFIYTTAGLAIDEPWPLVLIAMVETLQCNSMEESTMSCSLMGNR